MKRKGRAGKLPSFIYHGSLVDSALRFDFALSQGLVFLNCLMSRERTFCWQRRIFHRTRRTDLFFFFSNACLQFVTIFVGRVLSSPVWKSLVLVRSTQRTREEAWKCRADTKQTQLENVTRGRSMNTPQ